MNKGMIRIFVVSFLFLLIVGNAKRATEEAKLIAFLDGAASDYFGYSVSVDGDTAVIGTCGDDDNGTDSGSAYVYRLVDNTAPVITIIVPQTRDFLLSSG